MGLVGISDSVVDLDVLDLEDTQRLPRRNLDLPNRDYRVGLNADNACLGPTWLVTSLRYLFSSPPDIVLEPDRGQHSAQQSLLVSVLKTDNGDEHPHCKSLVIQLFQCIR